MNTSHSIFRTGLALVALFISTGATAQNLIVNGSFESPATPAGSYINFSSGSTALTGWTVIGAANGVSTVSGDFSQLCCSFPAQSGNAWLDISGFGTNSNEGIQQVVSTIAGGHYTLSFYVGNVFDASGVTFGTTSTVLVLIDGTQVGSFTNDANATTQNWRAFNVNFTAAGASTTIAFVNADPANDNHNGLDNVVLVGGAAQPAGAVPLPLLSPWAGGALIGLVAFAGFGWLRRKVRRD